MSLRDARVAGRGRARTMDSADGGSCRGRVAAATCTGGVGSASVSALARGRDADVLLPAIEKKVGVSVTLADSGDGYPEAEAVEVSGGGAKAYHAEEWKRQWCRAFASGDDDERDLVVWRLRPGFW